MDLTTTPGYVPGFPDELNLREMGGLPTGDGRHVRHGLIYRGSALCGLGPEGEARIDGFGLRYILDLRAASEAASAPDYVPDGALHERIGGMRDASGGEVDFSPESIARLERENPEMVAGGDGFMRPLYVGMAFGNPAVHSLVGHLMAHDAPLYYHCTAGKDRTGVSALVIGLILGVEVEALVADFLLTNEYRHTIIATVQDRMPAGTPPEVIERWRRANGVRVDDLQAVLDAIFGRFGTVEAYLLDEYGLGERDLADARAFYLE